MVSTLTIYVLYRDIDAPLQENIKAEKLSHSALLIKYENPISNAISHHLLEYNANNTINLYNSIQGAQQDSSYYTFKQFHYKKQKFGTKTKQNINLSPYTVAWIMSVQMFRKDYDIFQHNSHVAQESAKYQLALIQHQQLTYLKQVFDLRMSRINDPWGKGCLMVDQNGHQVQSHNWSRPNVLIFKRIHQ